MRLDRFTRKVRGIILILVSSFATLSTGMVSGSGPEAPIYVVGNFPHEVDLTREDLANLYDGYSRKIRSGETVLVVTLSDRNPATALFFQRALEKSVAEMKSHWSYMVFTGKGKPPSVFTTESDLFEFLERTPNAIGFTSVKPTSKKLRLLLRLE